MSVTDSQFYMWRTLFAVAHVDDVVTSEEVRFMAEALEDLPFSAEQRAVLNEDVGIAQNIESMFQKVTDVQDQAAFFKFAHELVHIDGDYGADEQAIMLKLKELHVRNTDLDSLVGHVKLELEGDAGPAFPPPGGERDFKKVVFSFRDAFLQNIPKT